MSPMTTLAPSQSSLLTPEDLYLFNEGSHVRLWDHMGSHLVTFNGIEGCYFAVWAPGAQRVTVMGDFNGWSRESDVLQHKGNSGIWEGFVAGAHKGQAYKYCILPHAGGAWLEKADPLAIHAELPPRTASVIWDLDYEWNDQNWMAARRRRNSTDAPISVYELHAGSWRHVPEEGNRPLTYREMAPQLAEYLKDLRFTHVEFLPIMEHPFGGSWGYQCTGFFAPTSRFGTPQDFMYLIDYLHQHGIGVILDWVPSHFPTDAHGLADFDGTALYEHADPRQGFHPDWNSAIFNYGRHEVRSFLLSSALHWLDLYHVDALRVDAVASMLYLDYSRRDGEWIPNVFGGNENLEAISFLRRFNEEVYKHHPDVQTIAEESTAWPMVSRPTYVGGLGFGLKWDMGWMHDTLAYMQHDPIHRKFHHGHLTFRQIYAYQENFMLPLSHDEVVHGKGSLLNKMPGDVWQKFANLRLMLAYMYGQCGKKLLFMGGEFGQWTEWNHDTSLDWHLLQWDTHRGVHSWVRDLNRFYREEPSMHELDHVSGGFEWIDCCDSDTSVLSFVRMGRNPHWRPIIAVMNFTPVPRIGHMIGAPRGGWWSEQLNSDSALYGGSDLGNGGGVTAWEQQTHGRPFTLKLTIPPLSAVFLRAES